jgi:hypothetical protein
MLTLIAGQLGQAHYRMMGERMDFAEKATEAEALAAVTENPLVRISLRLLARDYRALAKQENASPAPDIRSQPEAKAETQTK